MSLHTISILGINITVESKETLLAYIGQYLDKHTKLKYQHSSEFVGSLVIVTPNPEQIMAARTDVHFAELLNEATVQLPDGAGLIVASQLLHLLADKNVDRPIGARIAGVDFLDDLVHIAAQRSYTIGLIGGREGVSQAALVKLQQQYLGLKGWATDGPEMEIESAHSPSSGQANLSIRQAQGKQIYPFAKLRASKSTNEYFIDLAREIQRNNIRILFVGLGAPKQEYFIEKLLATWVALEQDIKQRIRSDIPLVELSPLVLMSVGGSFDILAGRVWRAPWIFRAIGLEWLWRLVQEPWRWRRQLSLLKFLWMVVTSGGQ